ncbi:diguanylate cyclase [Mycobacterium sp. 236(2023)]|uniref:sensor domain-containing diguanylate cyclase n=1 Tax=Mycobacterium sp. 236(2023) TaxID=3038163 RepID=UPI002415734E|nr:diguanylate cyclase [Mycobacterium sp. 236(2023)]MDG4664727.1 diguanylate cyclase [Mycobacterium sp. 236(2023)]
MMLLSGNLSDGETARLAALHSYEILDTAPEVMFDRVAALAAHVCGVPMALVGFVDAERQWIKSGHGVNIGETPRELSFCAQIMSGAETVEIPDTHRDSRFAHHPMVVGDPFVRFYSGVPLLTDGGHALGALCVLDREPRTLSAEQRTHLEALADQILSLLTLRRRARRFASEVEARQAADLALRLQQRVLSGVLEHTDVLVYAKDVKGRFLMSNRALEHVTQAGGELTGGTDYDFFPREVADAYRENDRRIMEARERQVFSEEVIHPDGSVHIYQSMKFPIFDDGGDVIGVGGVSTDVTDLAAARAAHAAAEQRWRGLVEQSPAAVIVVDDQGKLAYVNPEGVVLLGATSAEDVALLPALDFVPARRRPDTQVLLDETLAGLAPVRAVRGVLRRLDGAEILVEFNATAVNHAGVPSVQLEVRDVSADAAAQAALRLSAATDPLTGVLNRQAWDARVSELIPAASPQAPLTVAVIDLDNFKSYNDSRGHTAGDALLQRFAAAAAASIRDEDVFARWGGEEFIVALPGATPAHAEWLLNRLRHCVPFGQTCSIGYTVHLISETLIETVVRADKALYQAKSQGRNQLTQL